MGGLCLILDRGLLPAPAEEVLREALAAGVAFFQYRDKTGAPRAVFETAARLAALCRHHGALFVVNDRADVAAAAGADGVHLGQDDLPVADARKLLGPAALIGLSTHSPEEARAAEAAGADYIGFGSIFPTTSKETVVLQGIEGIRKVRESVALPIIAIGGIGPENAGKVIAAGADGVAVIAAVLAAQDRQRAARELINRIRQASEH